MLRDLTHNPGRVFRPFPVRPPQAGGGGGTPPGPEPEPDTTPDQFSFTSAAGAEPGTLVWSAPITVSGIDAPAAISVTGGQYRVNGGAGTTAPGTVTNGATVEAGVPTSTGFSAARSATVTIGGVSDTFTVTTRAADTTPDILTFAPVVDAEVSTVVTSEFVTATGFDGSVPIFGSGGAEYQILNALDQVVVAWTSAMNSISAGQKLGLRRTSSSEYETEALAQVFMGGVIQSFSITTQAEPQAPPGPSPEPEPAGLSGLFSSGQDGAWYDPSDLSTMFLETTGAAATTPAAVGDPVGTILDKSGNGHHATAVNDAARPVLRQDAGGRYYLESDGVNDELLSEMIPGLGLQIDMAVIAAGAAPGSTGMGMGLFGIHRPDATSVQNLAVRSAGNTWRAQDLSGAVNSGVAAGGGTRRVLAAVAASTPGSLVLRLDGEVSATRASAGSTDAVSPDNYVVGITRLIPATARMNFYGGIAAFRPLTQSEVDLAEAYLADKAGVTLV